MVAITAILTVIKLLPRAITAGLITAKAANKLIRELKTTGKELGIKLPKKRKRKSTKKTTKSTKGKTCRWAKVLASGKLRFVKKSVAVSNGKLKKGFRKICFTLKKKKKK